MREYNQLEQLYLRQKEVLELFLERNAISQEQYSKSLKDMTEQMGMQHLLNEKYSRERTVKINE